MTDEATARALERIADNTDRSLLALRDHEVRLVRLEESDKLHAKLERWMEESREDRGRMHIKLEHIGEQIGDMKREMLTLEENMAGFQTRIQQYSEDRALVMGGWKVVAIFGAIIAGVVAAVYEVVKLFESLNLRRAP